MSSSRKKRLLLSTLGLILLACYEPVVEGYLWFYLLWDNPVLRFLRMTPFTYITVAYLAARLGGRWGWVTGPMVLLASGIWYAFAEIGFKGDRDFEENILFAFFFAIILALPIGIIVSLISRKRRKRFDADSVG